MTKGTLHAAMAAHIERGDIPGIVTLVERGDDVQVDAIGPPQSRSPLAPP